MTEGARIRVGVRWALSLAVLGTVLWWLDPAAVASRLAELSPRWLLGALGVSVVQMALSAWRWRFTAARLGLSLPYSRAIGDYYLSVFVNHLLPGGVAGDALRAHRHAAASQEAGAAWRAVIIERASGQAVVVAGTLAVLVFVPAWTRVLPAPSSLGGELLKPVAFGLLLIAGVFVFAACRSPGIWKALGRDVHRALLARGAWPRQFVSSVVIVFSYALVFAMAARAVGAALDFGLLLALALPILLAMLIPLSVGGLGFREAAAAWVWVALGLPPEQGVAAALTYGLLVLVAAAPGALVLIVRPRR
jgi:uncharacterized membrane protein YbhN (UPF0104 family)